MSTLSPQRWLITLAGAVTLMSGPALAAPRGSVDLDSQLLSGDDTTISQSADGELRWRGSFADSVDGTLQVYGRLDNEDSSHDTLRLDEAWTESAWGPWDLRVGQQRVSWGVMESSRVTDALNASDFQADLIEPRGIGSPLARLRYWRSSHTLGLYWQPMTATNVYPGSGSPHFFGGGQSRLDYRSEDRLGVRYAFEGRDYSLSTSWLRGPEVDTYTFPQVIFIGENDPIRSERIGLAGQRFVGDLVLRSEVVHRRLLDGVDPATLSAAGPAAEEEILYSVGLEYALRQWLGRSDLTTFVEYFRSSDRERSGALTNDLFLGAEIRFNDLRSRTLEVFLQETFSDRADWFWRVRYGRLLTERIELNVEYTRSRGIYAGAPGSSARNEFVLGLTFGL